MQPLRVISPNWVSPIAVPGFGVYFPSLGLQDIPEPAIDWLESNGFVTTVDQSTESPITEESTTQRKKRNVKPDVESTESKE